MSPPTAKVVFVICSSIPSRARLAHRAGRCCRMPTSCASVLVAVASASTCWSAIGKVPAENDAEPSAVILERNVPAFGQADEDDASVTGLACPPDQSLPFELLDQDRDRWLRQTLELSELGDPPRAAAEGFQETDFGSRELSAELSDEQPGEQRRLREQLGQT